ncbi:MAG: ABC transporter substrate-binding protein [Eubacteriales bacterium]|nr:ABC transporter substrate-binding protein [Eubacteriales bacterium]
MLKRISLFLVAVLICGIIGTSAIADESKDVAWMQFQIEAAEAVSQLTELYMEQHPDVKITAEVNGTNLTEVLKAMFTAGDVPEIFMTEGYNNMKTYADYLTDLSDQPFVDQLVDASLNCITLDGKIVGLPVTFQSEGILYNKAIFEQYGLTEPTTLTELKAVCEALKAQGVTPFVNEFKDDWLLGQFLACGGYATIPDTASFTDGLYAGTATFAGNEQMLRSFEILDLMLQYGQDDPLSYGWNEACTAFALGEGAMMFEGDWVWDTLKSIDPELQLGMIGTIVSDDVSENRMAVDVNGVWHVGKGSANADIAIDILNWLATDEGAKEILLNTYKVIPVFKGWEYDGSSNPLCIAPYAAMQDGNVFSWPWPTWPDGFRGEAGKLYQEYILGNLTAADVLAQMDTIWADLTK